MIKIMSTILGLAFSMNVAAGSIVDLYGDESATAAQILKKHAQQVSKFEELFYKEAISDPTAKKSNFDQIFYKRKQLIETIKKEGGYLYVDFGSVQYTDKKNTYTTIEVVKKNQSDRLLFSNSVIKQKKYPIQHDLIQQMIDYDEIEFKLFASRQFEQDPKKNVCPVYHCFLGFDHPKLKPYLSIFNRGVIKEKQLILDTLDHDPSPERRAAAAFLLGHFKDPKEIVALLSSHINDPDAGVRNNVLRVIGMTIKKAKITDIQAKPYVDLLKSTQATDRNKALMVLYTAAQSRDSKSIIIQEGGANLVSLLRLKQPINHDAAYQVLKKVSGKNFDEYDYSAWENWVNLAKKKLV